MIDILLKKIDDLFIRYLRLERNIRPVAVKKAKNEISVLITEPGQRYTQEKSIPEVLQELKNLNPNDKQKLGSAMGKMIASDLTISF